MLAAKCILVNIRQVRAHWFIICHICSPSPEGRTPEATHALYPRAENPQRLWEASFTATKGALVPAGECAQLVWTAPRAVKDNCTLCDTQAWCLVPKTSWGLGEASPPQEQSGAVLHGEALGDLPGSPDVKATHNTCTSGLPRHRPPCRGH